MALINVKVAKITDEADSVRTFLLAKKGLFKLPRYEPGSHIDVHCGEGIIRQYSLCGDPSDRRHYLIAVKQVEPSRGGSDLMHLAIEEGDTLEIGNPRNNFHLDEHDEHTVLLAAGIGITPIIAMADRLNSLGKPFEMHYFSRSLGHAAFRSRLQNGTYADNVNFHEGLDATQTGAKLRSILKNYRTGAGLYMCGPAPFMDAVKTIALKHWPADAIKLERFAANPALAGTPTRAFFVELAGTGRVLEVQENQTILEVLEINDIEAAFSCEQGVCGTCITEIINGEPEHRDSFLSPKQREQNDRMCICVSRAKGEKVTINL